jgi:hypothetical protein
MIAGLRLTASRSNCLERPTPSGQHRGSPLARPLRSAHAQRSDPRADRIAYYAGIRQGDLAASVSGLRRDRAGRLRARGDRHRARSSGPRRPPDDQEALHRGRRDEGASSRPRSDRSAASRGDIPGHHRDITSLTTSPRLCWVRRICIRSQADLARTAGRRPTTKDGGRARTQSIPWRPPGPMSVGPDPFSFGRRRGRAAA